MKDNSAKLAQQQMAMQLFQAIQERNLKQQQLGLMQQNMIQDAMLAKRQNRTARKTSEDRLAFEQVKMQQEGSNAMRQYELGRDKLNQDKALAEAGRAHDERMAQLRAEGYMNPAVLEALSGLSGLPADQQELLLQQIESLTGKVLPKPVNKFQELIQPK